MRFDDPRNRLGLNLTPGCTGLNVPMPDKVFITKSIEFFMKRYAKRNGKPTNRVVTHAWKVIDEDGEIKIFEMDRLPGEKYKAGALIRSWEETYMDKKNFVIKRPNPEYTKDESERLTLAARDLAYRNTRYDFRNTFWKQVWNSLFGVFKTQEERNADETMECAEGCDYLKDKSRLGSCPNHQQSNPMDILWDKSDVLEDPNKLFV